jgi:hypothetical protein
MVGRKWRIFWQYAIEVYHGREDGNIIGFYVKQILVLHRFYYKILSVWIIINFTYFMMVCCYDSGFHAKIVSVVLALGIAKYFKEFLGFFSTRHRLSNVLVAKRPAYNCLHLLHMGKVAFTCLVATVMCSHVMRICYFDQSLAGQLLASRSSCNC